MLCCPRLSRPSASKRLLGGMAREARSGLRSSFKLRCLLTIVCSHCPPTLLTVESLLWYVLFGKYNTMPSPKRPPLTAGRVYRTRHFQRWDKNASRLARRLVDERRLRRLGHGLFSHPRSGRFGDVPPPDDAMLRAFLNGGRFIFTGPDRWNPLGLGTTALHAAPLVYNTKRSGGFQIGGRRFRLRRVAFPKRPSPEWFVVDLFENAEEAGASRAELTHALTGALQRGVFDRTRLREMAMRYGTRATARRIDSALTSAAA